MKRIVIVLLFALFQITSANAQTGQTLLWGDTLFVGPTFGTIVNQGDLIIAGNDALAQPKNRGFVIKIRNNEVINSFFHPDVDDSTGTVYSNVTNIADSNYLCFGTQYDNYDATKPAIITKLDSNLNFISETIFNLPPQYSIMGYGVSLIENQDTILYAFNAHIPYMGGGEDTDLGLLRVTSTGDTIESHYHHFEYPYGGGIKVFDIRKMPNSDKYFILCTYRTTIYDYRIIIINPDLSIDTMYSYNNIGLYTYGTRKLGHWKDDNTFLTGGEYHIFSKSDFGLFAGNLDLEGNVLDIVILNQLDMQEKPAVTSPIASADDSTIYIVGYDMCLPCDPVTDVAILEVYTVNSALDVLGYNVIADDGYYRASGVLTNEAGDLIVFGTKNVGNSFNYNLFVTQIPREELELTTSVTNALLNTTQSAYPNPATDKIHFKLNKKELQNGVRIIIHTITGKKVLSKPIYGIGNVLEVNINNLPEGIYLFEIINDNQIISQGKFIKQ